MSSPESSYAVETEGLEVRLEGRRVLHDVNFRVRRGQMTALIGPNGSGKTTLLRCLLGLEKASAGRFRLLGEDRVAPVLSRVGYVPQRLQLDKSFILSVREFLALRTPETRHWFWRRRAALDRQMKGLPAELEVEPLMNRPVAELSGGQLQRVLIAFGLLNDPELLLLDEPTAGIDALGERAFYELIAEVHRQRGLTVVLVSHDLSMVCRHAAWIYALNGTVCCEGRPEEVINADSLKKAYGLHMTPYSHHHGHESPEAFASHSKPHVE